MKYAIVYRTKTYLILNQYVSNIQNQIISREKKTQDLLDKCALLEEAYPANRREFSLQMSLEKFDGTLPVSDVSS